MNHSKNFSSNQSDPAVAMAFDFLAQHNRRQRPDLWFRVTVKVLAFAAGCLISLAFGLYDSQSSTLPATHVFHAQSSLGPITQFGWDGPR